MEKSTKTDKLILSVLRCCGHRDAPRDDLWHLHNKLARRLTCPCYIDDKHTFLHHMTKQWLLHLDSYIHTYTDIFFISSRTISLFLYLWYVYLKPLLHWIDCPTFSHSGGLLLHNISVLSLFGFRYNIFCRLLKYFLDIWIFIYAWF